MAINATIQVDGMLDGLTPLSDILRQPQAEIYPGSLAVRDGQRDVRVPGNMGVMDPSKLFGYVGTTWVAFMDISYLGPPVGDLIIQVRRIRKAPNVTTIMNLNEAPVYERIDYAKHNVAIVPDGYVLGFAGLDGAVVINGPWNISLTVSRVRGAEDYSKICAI